MIYLKEDKIREEVISKSTFITYLFKVETVDDVNSILAMIRKKHYDATHNCYAYILGDNANQMKCSDDGEPAKTAGAPMLEILKKYEVTNILAIVTRYFGGIKLGAGGLIRAYSGGVNDALKEAKFLKKEILNTYKVALSYKDYNNLLPILNNYYISFSEFLDNVNLTILVNCDQSESFITDITNKTSGNAKIISLGLDYKFIDV